MRPVNLTNGICHWFSITCLALFIPLAVWAGCLEDEGLMRSSINCLGMPTIDKFFDPMVFTWKGKTYLTVNDGNELEVWDATDPEHPVARGQSNFNVDNMGDSDYDLLNQSICDDCRYGVGVWKLGQVVFDLGTGAAPTWGVRKFYGTSSDPRGAFTYSAGAAQYLIAKHLPGDLGGEGTVYRIGTPSDLTALQKIDVPGVSKISNGIRLGNYLYLGMTDNRLYLFRLEGETLVYAGTLSGRGFMLRGKSVAVSDGRMVTAFLDGAKLWDVSSPATPALLWSLPGDYRYAALSEDFLWLTDAGDRVSTYHLRNPRSPTLMDEEFWDGDNPWNIHSECDWETGSTFAGDQLFMARYAVVQQIGFEHCPPPEPIFADGFESGTTGGWSEP